MKIVETSLASVLLIEPHVFEDERGHFYESFNQKLFCEMTGLNVHFVQDNHSKSVQNVLRGLHYQVRQPQGKLVRVIKGEIFDVAVDLRKGSIEFGRWVGQRLSAENRCQLWIPAGFAHGFLVLSEEAEVIYKTTDYYLPSAERCLIWNDPDISIAWPLNAPCILSRKDANGQPLHSIELPQ